METPCLESKQAAEGKRSIQMSALLPVISRNCYLNMAQEIRLSGLQAMR